MSQTDPEQTLRSVGGREKGRWEGEKKRDEGRTDGEVKNERRTGGWRKNRGGKGSEEGRMME